MSDHPSHGERAAACGSETEQGHHPIRKLFTTEEQRRRKLEQRSEAALSGVLEVLSTGAIDWNVAAAFRTLADAGRVIAFGRCDPIFIRALLDTLRLHDIEVLPRPTAPPHRLGWKPFLTAVQQSGVDLHQSVLYTADTHDIPLARHLHATTLVRPDKQAVRAFLRAHVPIALGNWARDDVSSAIAAVLGTSVGRAVTR
jgi:hypothetical protein